MDIRTKFTFNIPEALIEALGITENTPFVVSYQEGILTVEPILEETEDDLFDMDTQRDAWHEEGYNEGVFDGYTRGYHQGFDDATDGRSFDDTYPADCDYDCPNCRFCNATNDIHNAYDE
jgi:hypothetical protein